MSEGHARLSPSGADRWFACPGSVREEDGLPDTSNKYSVDGTHSHTLLEHCILEGLKDPLLCVDELMSDHDGDFVVDVARAARVNLAVQYLKERKANAIGAIAIRAESKVYPERLMGGREDCRGTADVIVVEDTLLEVIDYKDGMNPVEVIGNKQTRLYAGGALAEYWDGEKYPFTQVKVTIIQPKLKDRGLPVVNSHTLSVNEVLAFMQEATEAAVATDADDAPLVPGDHCKYCKAKPCNAMAEGALAAAELAFAEVVPIEGEVPADLAVEAAGKDTATMSDAELARIQDAAPLIKEMLKAVDAEILKRIQRGDKVPGQKVVYGRGSRAWKLDEEEIAKKLKNMGLKKAEVYKETLASPAQILKSDTLSDKQRKRVEAELIEKTKGRLTVVSESDSRQAVVFDAAEVFKDVEPVATEKPEVVVETQNEAELPSFLSM